MEEELYTFKRTKSKYYSCLPDTHKTKFSFRDNAGIRPLNQINGKQIYDQEVTNLPCLNRYAVSACHQHHHGGHGKSFHFLHSCHCFNIF